MGIESKTRPLLPGDEISPNNLTMPSRFFTRTAAVHDPVFSSLRDPEFDKTRLEPSATGHRHTDVFALWEPRYPWQPPAKNGIINITRAPFWHGSLRKDKRESLMNAGFYRPPGTAGAAGTIPVFTSVRQ